MSPSGWRRRCAGRACSAPTRKPGARPAGPVECCRRREADMSGRSMSGRSMSGRSMSGSGTGWSGYTGSSAEESPARCVLAGTQRHEDAGVLIRSAAGGHLAAYRALRRESFVREQGLFAGSDADDIDDDPRCLVLVALAPDGTVLGGVRLAPATTPDL